MKLHTAHTLLTRSKTHLQAHLSSTLCTNERETQLHPTLQRQSEIHPHSDEQCCRFPLRASEFSPFSSLLSLNLTSAHFELYMYPIHQGKTLPHANEAIPASNISNPSPVKPSSQTHPLQ